MPFEYYLYDSWDSQKINIKMEQLTLDIDLLKKEMPFVLGNIIYHADMIVYQTHIVVRVFWIVPLSRFLKMLGRYISFEYKRAIPPPKKTILIELSVYIFSPTSCIICMDLYDLQFTKIIRYSQIYCQLHTRTVYSFWKFPLHPSSDYKSMSVD